MVEAQTNKQKELPIMNIEYPISKYGLTHDFTLLRYSELEIGNWIFCGLNPSLWHLWFAVIFVPSQTGRKVIVLI